MLDISYCLYLEYGDLGPGVDHSLVYGVGGGHVDHLAQQHAIVHLLIHV